MAFMLFARSQASHTTPQRGQRQGSGDGSVVMPAMRDERSCRVASRPAFADARGLPAAAGGDAGRRSSYQAYSQARQK
jgi:hypothetical protein